MIFIFKYLVLVDKKEVLRDEEEIEQNRFFDGRKTKKPPIGGLLFQRITSCNTLTVMAGVPGFEPGNAGIRIRCLTAWR
ncbi:hypothetical protein, partial [Xenorhabdus littoralis]|uniref:hypothetical protein n=1 Tax=Xenorhabdus littoralis TaxID=2582835 RepID=UPI0029E80020